MNFGSFDACGSWQLMQSSFAYAIPRCAPPNPLAFVSWHCSQRSRTGWTASFGCADECGEWQVRQSSVGGCAFCDASFSFVALWQVKHASGDGASMSFFSAALCGLWHLVQSPAANAPWTLAADAAAFASLVWHLRQSDF